MAIRHVLFDADGVIQETPGSWHEAMRPYLGERTDEFLRRTWDDEIPMLQGRGDYLPLLAETLREFGVSAPVEAVYADVWHRIDVVDASLDLVAALREAGYGVHLGTNQESHRGRYMAESLGYEELFDVSCYSYDLGAMKPDPAFFVEAARRIGAETDEILFIDDNPVNVRGAEAVGMTGVHWSVDQGHPSLIGALRGLGIALDAAEPA